MMPSKVSIFTSLWHLGRVWTAQRRFEVGVLQDLISQPRLFNHV